MMQEKVKNSNSLFCSICLSENTFFLLSFCWVLNYRLPLSFQHIEYVYPLSFGIHHCCEKVTANLSLLWRQSLLTFKDLFIFQHNGLRYIFFLFICLASWSCGIVSFNSSGKFCEDSLLMLPLLHYIISFRDCFSLCFMSFTLLYFTAFCQPLHYLGIFFWSVFQLSNFLFIDN